MPKDTSISIRTDSRLKEKTERVLEQLGLNMTVVVNMLFYQIVREQAVPLSLSLNNKMTTAEELQLAQKERLAGFAGKSASEVALDMEKIITEAEDGQKNDTIFFEHMD